VKNIDTYVDAAERGNVIYFIGNGGSAATASHFANDIAINTQIPGTKQFRSVSLFDNIAVLTAVAYDEGYENLFVHQLDYV